MRRRIALTALAGAFGALVVAQPVQAGGHKTSYGHHAKYVTYNGSYFTTYPLYNPPVYHAPVHYVPAPSSTTPWYPASPYYVPQAPRVMLPPPPMGS
ncbi:MAG: hypothetical protein JWN86_4384 [Planctomycetota bacterium]|nr:hypothetical protein [Planctomycetota bacterium]